MSKFIGIKMVEAVPMTAQTAKSKGYRVSTNHYYTNDNSQDKNFIDYDFNEGYEVTYPDGYKSWCPKDVFEKNNIKIIEENLEDIIHIADGAPDFIKRMGVEHNELVDRYNKLNAFIFTDYFSTLDETRKSRMFIQRNIMKAYIAILQERIENDVIAESINK